MQPIMYRASVAPFLLMLGNLSAILKKAAAHAEARKIEPHVLANARLYPDMFPLPRQVQIACDMAKRGVARLAQVEAPVNEDKETTFDELQARIASTVAFIKSMKPEAFAGAESRNVTIEVGREREKREINGMAYLFDYANAHFYFHLTMAYAILRENGVELGKNDFVAAPKAAG
jgi:uncharacterized protein